MTDLQMYDTTSPFSSIIQLTESELFDNLIELLSNQNAWKNIYLVPDALSIIEKYYKNIIPYINGKNKSRIVMDAISKNTEITQVIKESIITYMEHNGMKINKHEMLFENTSHIYNDATEMYDELSIFITEKLVDPNFQTDVGNIFHILAKIGCRYLGVDKLKLLIDNGCDINALNRNGKTPIEFAIELDHKNTASIYKNLCLYKKNSMTVPPTNLNKTEKVDKNTQSLKELVTITSIVANVGFFAIVIMLANHFRK